MKNRLVDTFIELVAIDSPTGREDEFAKHMSDRLVKLGLNVTADSYGNLVARKDGSGEPVFFAAHMDTVEPGRGIKATVKGGYLVSDGRTILGADNKAAIAAMLEFLAETSESQIKTLPVDIILTRSEEIGNYGAVNLDISLLRAGKGYCFDSSNPVGTIVTASPIYERFDLVLNGKDAHASVPEQGINTLTVLQKLLTKFALGRLDDMSVINIGIVHAGSVRNTVPGAMTLAGELRSFREKELDQHKKRFTRMVEKVCYRMGATYTIDWVRENPGYRHTEGAGRAFVTETAAVISAAGLKPKQLRSWGVSDANIFNDRGLLCINLADGSEFSHSTEERQSVRELRRLVTVMRSLAT
ncbi:MAG: Cytosol non-specific dipeptidase [candidate division WS6 bacterium OLB20]|uniref:Cytosol non-specific dipeptidase n=1 Tax=candidate division WS6 bacterium OLB20 TaxID=1617426 RepID=A0A136M0P3_9BACT|nr:MAG: Cytosol non-specific dipeptidase [candidate division WS6 bacterium OLB20]